MNERIRELAQQAFQPINDISTEGVADRYTFEQTWFQMYNQKFAELIVRECLQIVNRKEYSYHEADPLWETAELIKEHFGVQE